MGRHSKEEVAADYSYSSILSPKERKKMREILNGQDAIDKSKIIKLKTIKSDDTNFFTPEKWNY